MNLYEIESAIMSLVDEETGEIKDFEAFDNLQMEKDKKIENTALFYKSLLADAEAIKKEKMVLAERQKVKENQASRLKEYLDNFLAGEKFESARVKVGYRKSESVEILDLDKIPEDYLKVKYEADKGAIKAALRSGVAIEGAEIVKKENISIK